jgi:DNA-binding response OmpR family regulator
MAYRLLLADDSVTIQRVIELIFADEAIDVVAVSDGDQAITRLEVEPFDIVLADIGMPGKNGFEVAAFVKARPAPSRVPVILLTGAFEPVDDARVTEVGASAVLAKPFDPQVLVARVRELLRGAPGGRPSAAPQPEQGMTGADALAAAPASAAPAAPSVDDYFERLDRAFASLNVPLEPRDLTRSPAPLTEPAPKPIEPAAAPAVSPDHVAPGASVTPPGGDSGSRVESRAPAAPEASPVGLAQTFATLLAVEQGELPASALAAPSGVNEDELVDRIARRVVEQMGDRAVRDLAADIVSRTAERLVREEIDRIKAGQEPR